MWSYFSSFVLERDALLVRYFIIYLLLIFVFGKQADCNLHQMSSLCVSLHPYPLLCMHFCFCLYTCICTFSMGGCVRCASSELSPSPGREFSPVWPQKERDGGNQQLGRIKVLITQRREENGIWESIILNYAWPDADLVAFIMLH